MREARYWIQDTGCEMRDGRLANDSDVATALSPANSRRQLRSELSYPESRIPRPARIDISCDQRLAWVAKGSCPFSDALVTR